MIAVHVALSGDDATGDGSEQRPFATLHRARDAVRVHRGGRALPAADVVIGAGTHFLTSTLELGVGDSRIRFISAPGANAVLSGGEPLVTSSWQSAGPPFPPAVKVTNVGAGLVSARGSVGLTSRRRDCHFDDTPCLSLLKHLLKVEGGCSRMTASPTARPDVALRQRRAAVASTDTERRPAIRPDTAEHVRGSSGHPSTGSHSIAYMSSLLSSLYCKWP